MSPALLLAAVADDDTGASDLAGMLADQAVPTLLVLDPAFLAGGAPQLSQARALVLATASRALPCRRAYEVTAEAVRVAASLAPRSIQIKYCSTFDSTAEGNIGPSLDAAMDVLAEPFSIAVPALPVNGRTTYSGYHFVNGRLLSDSPMRHHPLTPMTNPDLVAHLQTQTARRASLTPFSTVARGAGEIAAHWAGQRAAGVGVSVIDCIDDAQAAAIAEAACELRLVSGSSLFGMHLPAAWRRRGWLESAESAPWALEMSPGCGRLVVAGSCSQATAVQNETLARSGAEVIEVDTRGLLENGAQDVVGRAVRALAGDATVLIKTRSSRDDIQAVQAWGQAQGCSPAELGLRIASALAAVTRQIVERQLPSAMVCAGGETTSAICRALGIRAFAVGRNIQPGVPLCFPLEGTRLPMALKSGNFGGPDFYGRAFAAAASARASGAL